MIVQFQRRGRVRRTRWAIAVALLTLPACSRPRQTSPDPGSFTCQAPPPRQKDSFGSAMRTAMARMDDAMNAAPSRDPDRDFALMMIPHHQGKVEMALAELRFGKNEQLRRLAAGIIVEQKSEIALMRQILDEPTIASSISPSESPPKTELVARTGGSQ